MSNEGPQDAEFLLQRCLSKMTPDMREACIEVLEWMAELPSEQRQTITPEQINSLFLENFKLRTHDHSNFIER